MVREAGCIFAGSEGDSPNFELFLEDSFLNFDVYACMEGRIYVSCSYVIKDIQLI